MSSVLMEEAKMDKHCALVEVRKACKICVERNPGKIQNPANLLVSDPNVVSHWSQWLGHRQPILLIVGQDFGNAEYFSKNGGQDSKENKTNKFLYALLREAGIEAGAPPTPDPTTRVFLANSIFCAKTGAMNAPVLDKWINACADYILRPLARELDAPIVVGMGAKGCNYPPPLRWSGIADSVRACRETSLSA